MTVTAASTGAPGGADRFRALLPAHLWARDDRSEGTLRALLSAVAGELNLLEKDLGGLYDGWFVETCEEWLLPYLADLIGLTETLPDLGEGVSPRSVVANTLAHRRRKGTVAVLEQLAGEVTGWQTQVVEYFRLLAVSAHVRHPRPDRPAAASLRHAERLDHLGGGYDRRPDRSAPPPDLTGPARGVFDPLARSADVRGIGRGRGRYGLPSVGVFLFPLRTYRVGPDPAAVPTGDRWSQPRAVDSGYRVDPLGRSTPLFPDARRRVGTDRLAREEDLPVPLRPRRLLALLEAARAGELDPEELPVQVRIGRPGPTAGAKPEEPTGDPAKQPIVLGPERLRVGGLEDLATLPGVQVSVDTVTGHLTAYRDGQPASSLDLFVRYHYAGLADVGAGTYDRGPVHARVLAAEGRRYGNVLGVITVRADAVPGGTVSASMADGLDLAHRLWRDSTVPAAGTTVVVAVGDNASHPGGLTVTVPAGARLVLVAAARPVPGHPAAQTPFYTPCGLRPHLAGPLAVRGGADSGLVLDGFLLDGDLTVLPGQLGELTVSQSTVAGRIAVTSDADSDNGRLRVGVLRSTAHAIDLAHGVPALAVIDSVIDAEAAVKADGAGGERPDQSAVSAPGTAVSIDGSTLRGAVTARTIDGANSLLDGIAFAEQRQTGCLRHCYARPGSRLPRRFRCVPENTGTPPEPVYLSTDPGSPYYLALAPDCPTPIARGGEGGTEPGVHHHLHRPLRLGAVRKHLAAYVPAGLEIGIIGS
ncbi:phage tail protein [Streptomyces sp. NPDC059875]|uniref:phage tail protein n=1 Tax=unclassified Streptomyces TaxID=2593676 RepID=UPI0036586FB5